MPADPFGRLSGSKTTRASYATLAAAAGGLQRSGRRLGPSGSPRARTAATVGRLSCAGPTTALALPSAVEPTACWHATDRALHHLRAQATPATARRGAGARQARKRTRRRTTDAASAFQRPRPHNQARRAVAPPPVPARGRWPAYAARPCAARPVTACGSAVGRAVPRQRRDECGVVAA